VAIGSPSADLAAELEDVVDERDEPVDVPALPEEPDGAEAVTADCGVAPGTVGECVLKPSTAPIPATVVAMTMGARRMRLLLRT
jgi:hypothetical protein